MALMEAFKNFQTGLKGEVKQARAILGRIRFSGNDGAMGDNFRKYGPSFGAYDYDAFVALAKRFWREGVGSGDELYTVVDLSDDRVAIDYNGEIRAVFTANGKPLAFFRPDHHQLGYSSKSQEMEAFRKGVLA